MKQSPVSLLSIRKRISGVAVRDLFGSGIAYLLILVPVVLAFIYVSAYGVNVVVGDQWTLVQSFHRLPAGNLSLAALFAQHNELRPFFPRIAMLALGSITEYNNVAEMYLVLVCFLVTLACLLSVFKDGSGRARDLLLFVPVAFLVFSLRQHLNMLWGWQIIFAFAQMFGVLTFFFLYLRQKGNAGRFAFPAALASGVVATFSAAHGLLVWPVGLLQLLISAREARRVKYAAAAWTMTGLGAWTLYFWDFTRPGGHPSWLQVIANPLESMRFFLTLLGSSLFRGQAPAFASGLLLFFLAAGILVFLYRSGKLGAYSFWLALFAYSFLTVALITLGRSGFGMQSTVASKYTTLSVLAAVGVYVMLVKLALEGSRVVVPALGVLSLLVLLSLPISYTQGMSAGKRTEAEREKAASVLAAYKSQSDASLKQLYRDPEKVRQRARMLEVLGYNVFSEEPKIGAKPDSSRG